MIKNFFFTLYLGFGQFWWITLPTLVIFIITIMVLICFTIICIMDATYRPNIQQYPYNIVLDRVLPIISIFSPLIIIIWLNPKEFSLIEKFILCLIIYIMIILPVLHFYSKNRSWDLGNKKQYVFWENPVFFKILAIGILYPLIWGLLLSFVRLLKLGSNNNIFDWLYFIDLEFIFYCILIIPFYTIWFKLILWTFIDIKLYLWYNFTSIIRVINLKLLQYNLYFKFIKNLYKIAFVWGRFISCAPDVYPTNKKYPKYRYLLQYLYMKPYICFISLFIFIMLECLLTKGYIYYSFYLLFIYPIIYIIIYILYILYTYDFITDVCAVDYFSRNWQNPRYPQAFWINFENNASRYYFDWNFSEKEMENLRILGNKYLNKNFSFYKPALKRRLTNAHYCLRMKACFHASSGIRWMHSSAKPLHSVLPYFCKSFIERCSLIAENWKHYPVILKAESLGYITTDIPKDFYNSYSNNYQNMRLLLEQNCITNFIPLKNHGVKFSLFSGQILDSQSQNAPDVIADFKGSCFQDQRIHGIDQKSGVSSIGKSKIFSNISEKFYTEKLRKFEAQLFFHTPIITTEHITLIQNALQQLINTNSNLDAHQIVWASHLHLFPKNFIPPLKVPANFSTRDINPIFLEKLKNINLKVYKISEYLYFKNIREISPQNPGLSTEALDLFEDSFFVKLLKN